VHKYDVSMPLEDMYTLVTDVRDRVERAGLQAGVIATGYGHVGDGNLHLNVVDAQLLDEAALKSVLEPFVYEWVQARRGSISAEHGIGLLKKEHLHLSRSPGELRLMKQMKLMLDPAGILNPGKVFDM
jgi:FAD/FMN-containing dehydrogenase